MIAACACVGGCGSAPEVISSGVRDAGVDAASAHEDAGPGAPAADAGQMPPTPVPGEDASLTGCTNLQCQQRQCSDGVSTSISGKVYDPAGKNPLYNVVVYVPNEAVQPLPSGASCDSCASLYTGAPIAVAQTDASGSFVLKNAPEGTDIPLVVQVGKWRRQFTLPAVRGCADNPLPDKLLTLPKNRSEGDIPNIAVSTGNADTLECLLRRVGLDASEYGAGGTGTGKVHIFRGGNNAPDTAPSAPESRAGLWGSTDSLMAYDILLLSCEGKETANMNQQALHDYASAGGRVFASHFHYAWFNTGPYASENLASWTPGSNHIGDIMGDIVTTLPDGQPFPKGQALNGWLDNVGALQNGQLPIQEARHNADVSAANTPSQTWITAAANTQAPGAAQYFSFNTPTSLADSPDDHPAYCGRVVFSDLHVGAASGDDTDRPVPDSCADHDLSAQEKALEFMLFDLSSCVTPDDRPPEPPAIVPLR